MKNAVAYYIGADPGLRRQKEAVQAYASKHRLKVVDDFGDESAQVPLEERARFTAMLARVFSESIKVVLVGSAELISPEAAARVTVRLLLQRSGVELVPVNDPDHFGSERMRKLAESASVILATARAFATRERLARMKEGRDRASERLGYRVEGRAAWGRFPPEHRELARQLNTQGKSLRQISAELAARGFLNRSAKAYGAQSISRMLRAG